MQDLNSRSSTYQYEKIFNGLPGQFNEKALELFRFQYMGNTLYRHFANHFSASPDHVKELKQIPFLPVSFFKTETVKTGEFRPEIIFKAAAQQVKYLPGILSNTWTYIVKVSLKGLNFFMGVAGNIVFSVYCLHTWKEQVPHWYGWWKNGSASAGIRRVDFIYMILKNYGMY